MPRYLPDLVNFRVVSVGDETATSLTVEGARAVAADFRADEARWPGCGLAASADALEAACTRLEAEATRFPTLARGCGLTLAEAA